MNTVKAGKAQSGISIVEALVTMVILLIILGGVYQIFQSHALTYRMQEGMSRLQENGRFAMDFLIRDIRMAGYLGCISSLQPNLLIDLNNIGGRDIVYDLGEGLEGFSGISTISYPLEAMVPATNEWWSGTRGVKSRTSIMQLMGITGTYPLPGSDILTLRFATGNAEKIIDKGPSFVQVDENTSFSQCDIVISNDCASVDIFQIVQASTVGNATRFDVNGTACDATPGPGNAANPRLSISNTEAHLMSIASVSFFVAMNSTGQPSLYRKIGTEASQELVEGVEAMKVMCGLDTNNDYNVDSYVSAAGVDDWSAVRSLRIGLLLRSPEEIRGMEANTDSYDLLGSIIGPANDMRLRRIFEASVGVRNRLQ